MEKNEEELNDTSNSFDSEVQAFFKEPNLPMFIVHPDPANPEKAIKKDIICYSIGEISHADQE